MADGASTLREVLQGYNSFQRQLGILPGASQNQGIAPIQTPAVKHPGEVSQQLSMQMQQQLFTSAQQAQQTRMLPPPNAMALLPAGQDFARQYQERMNQIQGGYQQPFQAQQMAQTQGLPGFQGLPSPVFMTAPSMGVFRPGMMPPPPISMARTPPMFQMPFAPQLPSPMFQTPLQMQQGQWQQESNEMFAGTMAGIPLAARMGAGFGGAAMGARFGGRFGAVGGALGAIGGGLLGFGPMGGLAEQGAAGMMAPAVERRAFGLQMQNMSRNFVVSGSDLAAGGRGLSMGGGIQTANMMRRAVDRDETAGFNMRDMMGITSLAGDMGMMDMAQNSGQIVNQAKNVARGLSAFMQLANEPDIRRAMQQMSQMRAMGLTIPETTAAMQNAQQFARMAGTTVSALGASAGLPGAMTFQQLGMTGGLGYQVGMGAGAMARQAVAGGAFTSGQLAMAGGTSGVAQQLTEAAGAGLGVTFPMMAALTRNAQGQLSLDPSRVQGLSQGQYSLTEQASMAQDNIQRLGGSRALTEMSTRLNELRDQMGRMMGPQGSLMYTIQQGRQMQKELGGSIGFGGALQALGLDPQQARTIEVMAQSPSFWRNMKQQTHMRADDARAEEAERREQAIEYGSWTSRAGRAVYQPVKDVGAVFSGIGEGVSNLYDSASGWFSTHARRTEAAQRGQAYVHESGILGTQSEGARKAVNDFIGSAGYERWAQREGREASRARGQGGTILHAGLAAGANVLSGGMFDGPGQSMQVVRDVQTVGGFTGWMAEHMPNVMGVSQAPLAAGWREKAADIEAAGRSANQAAAMSRVTAVRLREEGGKAYKELGRRYGKDVSFEKAQEAMVTDVLKAMTNRSGGVGKDELREIIQKSAAVGLGKEGAAELLSGNNAESVIQSVLNSVGKRVGKAQAASWEATRNAQGSGGAAAGETLQDVVENLEDQEKDADAKLRVGGFWSDVSDEGRDKLKDLYLTTKEGEEDETMALHAMAMMGDDSGSWYDPKSKGVSAAIRARGKKMLDDLNLSPEAKARAEEKFAQMKDDPEAHKALLRAGTVLSGIEDPAERRKAFDKAQGGYKGRRGALATAKGAARLGESIGSLQGLARSGTDKGGQFSEDATLEAMNKIAGNAAELNALREESPEAYEAVKALKDAGEDPKARAALATKFNKALASAGDVGSDTYGGKGAGGAKEKGIKAELGTIQKLASELTGNAQEDFARSVPAFSKATLQLHDAAERLDKMVDAISMAAKMVKIW